MKVGNRLPALRSAVYHETVPLVVQTHTGGRLYGAIHDFRPHFGVLNRSGRFDMLPGDDQKVHGSLRINVLKDDGEIIFVDDLRRDLPSSYSAKKTLSVQKSHLTALSIL